MSAASVAALAVGLAAAASAAVYATTLVRLALTIHRERHSFGPCRGAGFLGMGVLASGVTAAGAGLLGFTGDTGAAARTAGAGLAVAIAMYLLGLLLLPGAAGTVTTRLRRLLDGAGSGVCLMFAAWLLVIVPRAGALALAVALATCVSVAAAAVTGLRAARYRPAALACAGGSGLGIVGLATLAIGFEVGAGTPWLALAGAALAAGPVLIATGARRAEPRDLDPADVEGSLAGYPLLALPVGIAVVAAVYHLVTVGSFDRTSLQLAIGGVTAVGLREALAAVDVRRYARRLAAQEAHFRSLVAGATEVTVVVDADLVVRWQSPAAARHFGLSDQDVVGRPFTALVHPDDAERVREALRVLDPDRPALVEARVRDGFGQWRDTESTVSDLRDNPEVAALVVHVRDIGERKELERTLHRMAFTDQLTGLANRRELLRAVATARLTGTGSGAVFVVELDGLAGINDARGHEVGDAVLIEVAQRLRDRAGAGDLPARTGGAEFAVLLADEGGATAHALGLLAALGAPYRPPGATVHLSGRGGLARLSDVDSVEDVLRRADLAVCRSVPGEVTWYDDSMEAALRRRRTLERELPGVVNRGELDLAFQLVIELAYRHPVGVEALLRWRHPVLGTVPAEETIATADALGLTDEIGEWVLHKACRQLSAWLRDGWDLWLSVNVAPSQLAAPGFVETVGRVLDTHLVAPGRLLLEVPAAAPVPRQLDRLRGLGVRTALDRFGAGPTALTELPGLPVDVLKLDRALFTEPAGRAGPAAPILDVVVGLGDRLGVDVIAAGLEDEADLDVVRGAGCRYGQGYLFHRPAPGEHVEAYLEQHRTRLL